MTWKIMRSNGGMQQFLFSFVLFRFLGGCVLQSNNMLSATPMAMIVFQISALFSFCFSAVWRTVLVLFCFWSVLVPVERRCTHPFIHRSDHACIHSRKGSTSDEKFKNKIIN